MPCNVTKYALIALYILYDSFEVIYVYLCIQHYIQCTKTNEKTVIPLRVHGNHSLCRGSAGYSVGASQYALYSGKQQNLRDTCGAVPR